MRKYSVSNLICVGINYHDKARPKTAVDYLHVAKSANEAVMRLSEGVTALGRLMTEFADGGCDSVTLARAGLLVEEVSDLICTLGVINESASDTALEMLHTAPN